MPDIWYDYLNHAWVRNGLYGDCHHATRCQCYGRLHKGEPPGQAALAAHQLMEREEAGLLTPDD